MPATEAQIRANQANSKKSTGPKTPEGKEASRANAYKHGLTGGGVVMPNREAVEVDRRHQALCHEFGTYSESGRMFARLAATMSVRAERCADHENAILADRARTALAEFETSEGLDPTEVKRLRSEVEARALFDPSDEATLARKYEAAAIRTLLRALKELERLQKQAKKEAEAELASFSSDGMTDEEFDAEYAKMMATSPPEPVKAADPLDFLSPTGRVDVPITIGRRG